MRIFSGKIGCGRQPFAALHASSDARHAPAARQRGIMRRAARWLAIGGAGVGLSLAPLYACSTPPGARGVALPALERAARSEPAGVQRWLIADAAALEAVSTPLGRRLSLFQLRTAADWRCFERSLGLDVPRPDLRRGIVVGILCRAGEPLADVWPVALDAVRQHAGAGLLSVRFAAGNYLPDGSAFAETTWVDGLVNVLAVDVNGERYYPGRQP